MEFLKKIMKNKKSQDKKKESNIKKNKKIKLEKKPLKKEIPKKEIQKKEKPPIIPIGTFTKKIQCQLKLSVINPPMVGPNVGPMMIPMPKMAFAIPIFSGGKAPMIMVCALESKPPPPNP